MKILLFANSDWFHYNFNLPFAKYLGDNGYEVIFTGPQGSYKENIEICGFTYITLPITRGSLNPFKIIASALILRGLLKKHRPDIIHNFTLVSILIGTLGSIFLKEIKIINEVTGMGHLYTSKSFTSRFTKLVFNIFLKYGLFLRRTSKLVLLNQFDFDFFSRLCPNKRNSIIKILGAGVDSDYYISSDDQVNKAKFRILLPARVIKEKGVYEFVEAAQQLSNKDVEFIIAGDIDRGNPSAIKYSFIKEYVEKGVIQWLGYVEDMKELYKSVSLVVLPSYREGLPTSLTEAACCRIPIITTNVPGCIDVVEHNKNGFIIPPRDSQALILAVKGLINNPSKCKEFGLLSRIKAEQIFSQNVIFKQRRSLYYK